MGAPDSEITADRSTATSSGRHAFTQWRLIVVTLVTTSTLVTALGFGVLFSDHHATQSIAIAQTTLAAAATGLALIAGKWFRQTSRTWTAEPYRVFGLPAVRYKTAEGDYIKFERYQDGVSANWSTGDGPAVLLSIPLVGESPRAQFWTLEDESEEVGLSKLAPDLHRHESKIIRAWVETDRELILWRLADPDSAGIAQLGVLMRSWSSKRVAQLVKASATMAVQTELDDRLQAASEWVDEPSAAKG